jgi:hypothetical protein
MTDIFFEKSSSREVSKSRLRLRVHWRRWVVPMGVFLMALLPRLIGLGTFLTADEDDQIMFAHLFLKYVLQGDFDRVFFLGYPGIPTLILGAGGVVFRYFFHYANLLPLSWVDADLMTTLDQITVNWRTFTFEYPLDFLWWVRMPMAIAAALSILGVFLLTRRLLNERLALLITLLIAFDPFILAHTRVIHVDAPSAYFMFLSFLAFILYLNKGGWRWLALAGIFAVLAVLSKTPAAILGPILLVSGIIYALLPPPGQLRSTYWKRLGVAMVVGLAFLAATLYTFWPIVQRLVANVESVNRSPHLTAGTFWTEWQSDLNPLYYLWVFPFHLTPLVTVGVLAGLVLTVVGVVAYVRRQDTWPRQVLPLLLGLISYIAIFIAVTSLVSRRGDRYILPVYFPAAMLAALAWWWLAGFVPGFFKRVKITSMQILGVAVALQMLFVLLYHPYYLAYFNPLMGGYRTAPYWVNVGWGEGLERAAAYLNEITGPEKPPVAAWYSNQFAPYYHGPTADISNESAPLTADYAVFYINQVQRGFPSSEILTYFQQRDPVEVIEIGGIPYVWVYAGPVVSQRPPQDYQFSVEALLGGGARLLGLDVPQTKIPANAYTFAPQESAWGAAHPYSRVAGIPVTLYWETVGRIKGGHNIYIRLVDESGNIWGQVDRMILAGLWRPDRWFTGYYLRDEYKVPLDPAIPPGTYHFEVGMYNFTTGESLGIAKNIGKITLTPAQRLIQPAEVEVDPKLMLPIDSELTLIGHNYSNIEFAPGSDIVGKVYWQAAGNIDRDYQVEFSLLDATHQKEYVVAKKPLSPTYPPAEWRNREVVGAAYRFRVPAVAPPGKYPLALNVVDMQTGKRVGQPILLSTITVEAPTRNFELPQNVAPVSAVINDEIELVGYKLVQNSVDSGKKFGLILYWRSLNFANSNYTVFVHAVGPDQVMRGQWDSVPVQGKSPTGGWIPGEIIEDHYQIPMADDAPPWKYDIFVGMYDPVTGQRLTVTSPNAPISDNRVWLTRIQVSEDKGLIK